MTAPEPHVRAWTTGRAHVALTLDTTVYSTNAALRAAYKLSDRCAFFLQPQGDPRLLDVFLIGKGASADVEPVVLAFMNELADQVLRERLETQFGTVRDLIVAQAFSEGNLLDSSRDDGDYHADPRGAGRGR